MTNEEKAIELVRGYGRCCKEECRLIALKMADWKDHQFKDAINSTLDYFDRGREAGFVSENSYNDMKYFASKIINKLFKEE